MSNDNEFRKFDEFRKLTYENNDESVLWDDDCSFVENFKRIVDKTLLLPYHDVQIPFFIAYALLPSALSTIVPVMFFCGGKGSGKSTAMQLIAAIHGQEVLSALSSGAAIRNHINKARWYDSITCDGEKNTCLLFDNVSKTTFKNEFLYLLFLNGYNRKTDQVILSKGDGTNYTFRVFTPKIISSIHHLLSDPELDELSRRCMTLRFKSFEAMTPDEKNGRELNAFDMLNVESLDLSILRAKYNDFWQADTMMLYAMNKKAIKTAARKNQKTLTLDSHRWTISLDLLATGLTFNLWQSPIKALIALQDYWIWHDKYIGNKMSPLQLVLLDIIESETLKAREINAKYNEELMIEEISPSLVSEKVKHSLAKGELDETPLLPTIAITMNNLGWCLEKNDFKKMVWRKIK